MRTVTENSGWQAAHRDERALLLQQHSWLAEIAQKLQ